MTISYNGFSISCSKEEIISIFYYFINYLERGISKIKEKRKRIFVVGVKLQETDCFIERMVIKMSPYNIKKAFDQFKVIKDISSVLYFRKPSLKDIFEVFLEFEELSGYENFENDDFDFWITI